MTFPSGSVLQLYTLLLTFSFVDGFNAPSFNPLTDSILSCLGINRVSKKYTLFLWEAGRIGVTCSTSQYSMPLQFRIFIMYGGITCSFPTTAANIAG